MGHEKVKKPLRKTTDASFWKEMEKPRMSMSARTAEQNMDSARIVERPGTTTLRTINKPSRRRVRARPKWRGL